MQDKMIHHRNPLEMNVAYKFAAWLPRIIIAAGLLWSFSYASAFPSGHLATAMMTVTVLSENYPEYTLIRPIGYGLMTLLGFQMVNNGVHWASDYPLALAIGYGLGKVAVSHGRRIVPASDVPPAVAQKKNKTFLVLPLLSSSGGGLAMIYRF